MTNTGSIEVFGDGAYGIFAQSVGGGGGNGGVVARRRRLRRATPADVAGWRLLRRELVIEIVI